MNDHFSYCFNVFSKSLSPVLSDDTKYNKLHYVTIFLAYLEEKGIECFENFEIDTVYGFLTSLPYASQTKSNIQFALREFFDTMFENGISSVDGRRIFPVITTNKRDKIISYYQTEEVLEMVNAIDIDTPDGVRDKCMVLLAAQTGLRESDILQLSFDDIHWDKELISKVQKKTGLNVTVPLPSNLKLLLLDYIKNHRPDSEENYVFICQKTRRRYSSSMLYYIVAKYFDKAGVDTKNRKHGPHALRHSLATNLLKGNSPMPVITGILGHKNLNTTSKYLSIDVDSLRKCSLEVTDE